MFDHDAVAVVVAFFVCWAPFHAQRLMTIYIREWTTALLEIQSLLFYVSGTVCMFRRHVIGLQ